MSTNYRSCSTAMPDDRAASTNRTCTIAAAESVWSSACLSHNTNWAKQRRIMITRVTWCTGSAHTNASRLSCGPAWRCRRRCRHAIGTSRTDRKEPELRVASGFRARLSDQREARRAKQTHATDASRASETSRRARANARICCQPIATYFGVEFARNTQPRSTSTSNKAECC